MKGLDNLLRTAVVAGGLFAAANGAIANSNDNCKLADSCYKGSIECYENKNLNGAKELVTEAFKLCKEERTPKNKNWLVKVYKDYVKKAMAENDGLMSQKEVDVLESAVQYVGLKNINDWEFCALLAYSIDDVNKAKPFFNRAIRLNKGKTIAYLKPLIRTEERKKAFNI